MTANDWPASAALSRPTTPLALEARPRFTVPAIAPATLVATVTLPERPAAMLAGETSVRLPLAEVARTSRLSWKAASVVAVLVTPIATDWPRRTLPIARVPEARVARARS